MNAPQIVVLAFLLTLGALTHAKTYVTLEGSSTWQSRNDQRIPGDGGTEFSLSDFDTGPFLGYRLYAGHIWNERHEVRALYAPLIFEIDGQFGETKNFEGQSFAADTPTEAYYKFNSYRLTYAYHFEQQGAWNFALGFTAKIRDAKVRLQQGALRASKNNVGFVPLVNFQAKYAFSELWRFRFDLDGMAAPQGRAIDAGLFIERDFAPISAFIGYRTVEGGADNDEVYSFAWIHSATLGARYEF